ncbi:MAG: hypothetical protein OXG72_21095 [Acidobacteria bacterium]|nr:hypothetical protein [Acidobacteriota bacterium]
MICMSYETIVTIVGFTGLALYSEHCKRKIERAMDRLENTLDRNRR